MTPPWLRDRAALFILVLGTVGAKTTILLSIFESSRHTPCAATFKKADVCKPKRTAHGVCLLLFLTPAPAALNKLTIIRERIRLKANGTQCVLATFSHSNLGRPHQINNHS